MRHPDEGQPGGGWPTGLHDVQDLGFAHLRTENGEHRTEYHDRCEQRHRVVADAGDDRVLDDPVAALHVRAVGQDQAPAGPGVPGILSERFEPDARLGQCGPVGREQEANAFERAVQRQRASQRDQHDQEQRRDQYEVRALDRTNAVPDDECTKAHRERMKSNRKTAALEAVPYALRRVRAQRERGGAHLDQVVHAPARHDGVIEHDRRRHEADERTHPRVFPARDLREGADHAHAAATPERVFGDDQRHAPGEQEHEPRDEKGAGAIFAGILRRDAGKTPDVAGADRDAEYAQEHAEARRKALIYVIGQDGFLKTGCL